MLANKHPNHQKGFSFIEVVITMSLFLLLAGVGVGAYFRYYSFSLINRDINNTLTLIKDTRFKAQKNPTNSNYGIHLDPIAQTLTSFKETYNPAIEANIVYELKQLEISEIDLQPNPGTTKDILFQAQTGKTENSGSFTISDEDFSKTFIINSQGVVD